LLAISTTSKLHIVSQDPIVFIFHYLILRREAKRSLEGPMAYTGSSFEALLCKAPQDEAVVFHYT